LPREKKKVPEEKNPGDFLKRKIPGEKKKN
jgi:hypothetical protein